MLGYRRDELVGSNLSTISKPNDGQYIPEQMTTLRNNDLLLFESPCGLLITELVTNAFKYAFPTGQPCIGTLRCEITVTAEWDGATYTLTVADNGVGLPAGLDWTKTKTLGLLLVKMLGQNQLQGKIELDRTCGTTFRLRFAPKIARL